MTPTREEVRTHDMLTNCHHSRVSGLSFLETFMKLEARN